MWLKRIRAISIKIDRYRFEGEAVMGRNMGIFLDW